MRVLYFWQSVGNKLLTTFSNMLADMNFTNMRTCDNVFRGSIVRSLATKEDRFGFEPELTAKIAKMKIRLYEVGISYYVWGSCPKALPRCNYQARLLVWTSHKWPWVSISSL